MLISLHLPKTAGSSFLASLSDHYHDKLIKDYGDLPLHTTPFHRHKNALTQGIKNRFIDFSNLACIHGHFLPLKYRFYNKKQPRQYVTWMREPAERIASQYYYMKRNYNPDKAQEQSLLKKMFDENWSLERFCLGPELKNTYSKFLWGFPFENFSFVGIVEDYESELSYFSEVFLDDKLKHYNKNTNNSFLGKSYYNSQNLKKKVQNYHSKDVQLYEKALKIKNRR